MAKTSSSPYKMSSSPFSSYTFPPDPSRHMVVMGAIRRKWRWVWLLRSSSGGRCGLLICVLCHCVRLHSIHANDSGCLASCNPSDIAAVKSSSNRIESSSKVDRESVGICSIQCPLGVPCEAVHDETRSKRSANLLGFRRRSDPQCCSGGANDCVLAE